MNKFNNEYGMVDFIHKKLQKQGKQSLDERDECVYRSKDGCRCAVGMVIDDKHYTVDIEGQPLNARLQKNYCTEEQLLHNCLTRSGIPKEWFKTLRECQSIHDGNGYYQSTEKWFARINREFESLKNSLTE